jgi:peptide chain release factor subunit 1
MADDPELQNRRLQLKLALEDLREMRGFGTELVTVIIPPDRKISDARQLLQNEHGQAANIKSKSTRKNVQGAIESAISSLNTFKNAGERGVALFVGAIIVGNNKTRLVNVVIDDPPVTLTSFRYRCDSVFEISQLEDMLIDRNSYGLFVIDRGEAAYGIATGKRIHVQEHLVSNIMGKHRQGGQSAQRFERLIEEAAHKFFKRVTEHACNYWLPNIQDIQAIIIGGPGHTKEFVIRNEYFHHEIQKKISDTVFDVGYSNDSGIRELVGNAGSLMGEIELDSERQVVNEFLREIMQTYPKATYGEAMIRRALDEGAVDRLLISETLRQRMVTISCNPCSHEWIAQIERMSALPACPSCGEENKTKEVSSISLIDELVKLAARTSAEVVFISEDSEEGASLKDGFGGLAALLRYPLSLG